MKATQIGRVSEQTKAGTTPRSFELSVTECANPNVVGNPLKPCP